MKTSELRVFHFAAYITKLPDGEKLIGDEWDAMKMVKAIKGDPVNGWATIPLTNGRTFRLEESTRDGVFDAIAEHAIAKARHLMPTPTVWAFVPVPSSKSTPGSDCSSTPTHRLARALAAQMGEYGVFHDVLRMKVACESARKGGTRDPKEIYDNLQLLTAPNAKAIILVDDVLMSGGHLRAARALIEENGGRVSAAMCAANTIHEHTPASAFDFKETKLAHFDPKAPNWFEAFRAARLNG